MSKLHTVTQRVGNTKTTRSRRWSCTWNNYSDEDYKDLTLKITQDCLAYIVGKEVGEKGTKHLQFYVEYKDAKSFDKMKKLFPKCHIESAKGDRNDNFKYCSKEGNYISNPLIPRKPKIIKELYPWQKAIEDIVKTEPDERTVYWFYETKGGAGKTALIKYLLSNYPQCEFSRATKSADILTVANENKTCYLFDFARCQEGFAPYMALEQLKDGLISDSKLKKESRNIMMDSPHIICFANWKPESENLSQDRWKITKIG